MKLNNSYLDSGQCFLDRFSMQIGVKTTDRIVKSCICDDVKFHRIIIEEVHND